jgi:hypothetical protein
VVYLKNADATKLAATLRAAVTGEVRTPTNNPTLNNATNPMGGMPVSQEHSPTMRITLTPLADKFKPTQQPTL